jgi:hypothetical protein
MAMSVGVSSSATAKAIAPNDIAPRPEQPLSTSTKTARDETEKGTLPVTRSAAVLPGRPDDQSRAEHRTASKDSARDVLVCATTPSVLQTQERSPASTGLEQGQEPPLKRRRAGRRVTDPGMTSDERRRLRTLKNRESAMRSLQKKAEYASKLEADERTQREIVATQREALQQLVQSAIEARSELVQVSDQADLVTTVDDCVSRCRAAIVDSVTESAGL